MYLKKTNSILGSLEFDWCPHKYYSNENYPKEEQQTPPVRLSRGKSDTTSGPFTLTITCIEGPN